MMMEEDLSSGSDTGSTSRSINGGKEIPLIARNGELAAYSSEADSESDLEEKSEGALLIDSTVPTTKPCSKEKMKAYLMSLNWRNIAATVCLWLAVLTCSAAYSLMGPFFPQEALDKGASPAIVGVIIALTPFSVAVLSPIFGYLLPLAGVTTYTLLGLLMVGCSYILLAFVMKIPSTWGFILVCMVLRATEGVGTAMFITATFSTFPKLFPNHVSIMVGLFETANGLGNSIGRPLGGLLYYVGGYMVPFLTVGSSAIIISIPCVLLVRKMEIERAKHFLSWIVILNAATDLYFLTLALVIVAGFIALSNQGPALQPFLIEKFHLSEVEVSFVYFVLATSFAITNIPAGIISNRLKNVYISAIGLLIAAFGEFLLGVQEYAGIWHLWMVYVSLALNGIGGALAVVPIYANLIHVAERYLGKENSRAAMVSFVSGIVSSSISFGQFGGPLLSGVFTNFVPFTTASILIGEIILAEVLLLLGISIIDKFTSKTTKQKPK